MNKREFGCGLRLLYLVLEVYWSVEVGDFRIYRFAHHFTFTSMHEGAHFCAN